MKLDGEFTFDAPRDEVWAALLDPVVLASIMPGCDKLDLVDGVYEGVLKVKVGPVQGKFNGKVELRDIDAPAGYRMNVDGKGQQGFVKADAGVVLTEQDGGKTHMTYDADAKVGGKIASVGQRLIDASAKAIIKQSLEGLHETILARHAHSTGVKQAEQDAAAAEAEAQAALEAGNETAAKEAAAKAEAARAAASSSPAPVAKQKSQAEMARSIAAEVSKELIPPVVRYGLIALVVLGVLAAVFALAS